MTIQLTKSQIDQLKVVLAAVGLDVKKLPAKGLSIWAKRRIARAYKGIPYDQVKGVTSYQVRGKDGQWHDETSPGFAAAVSYQKRVTADWWSVKNGKKREACMLGA